MNTRYKPGNLIYLASPYNHTSDEIKEDRFNSICNIASLLINQGVVLYSPIAHNHPIAKSGTLPASWEWWEHFDSIMISKCDELWVCMIEGFRTSIGIAAEIEICRRMGKPVRYLCPVSLVLFENSIQVKD